MAILFRFAPRAGAPIDQRQDRLIDAGEVRVGRSSHCAIRLLRAGVHFEHALIRAEAGALAVEPLQGAKIEGCGDTSTRIVLAAPGDSVRIGPYILTLDPQTAAGDHVITVMPDALASSDESAVSAWYQGVFGVDLPNIRLLTFGLSCAIVMLFFALPFAFGPGQLGAHSAAAGDRALAAGLPVATLPALAGAVWNVGAFSRVHSGFGGDCAHCHKAAFFHVPSAACLDCHRGIGQHADPVRAPAADLSRKRCETCHREHKGPMLATADRQSDCVACHGNIRAWAAKTQLADLHDFATDHPQFAPELVQDALLRTTQRVTLGGPEPPDHSGLRFTHATHLKLDTLNGPGSVACATCHLTAPGGVTFRQVGFETACARCHTLQFEPKHPEWTLPHGHPEEVASRIAGYYARAALAGETFAPPATDLFAKPGAKLPAPALEGSAMVSSQTAAAMMSSIARSACGQCHTVTRPGPGEPGDSWTVAPVFVQDRFEPRSTFSHASHATTPCDTCHASRTSDGGPLALLPNIKTCRLCHAGEAGATQRVASTCVSCHVFHDDTRPLLPGTAPAMPRSTSIASEAITRPPAAAAPPPQTAAQ